MNTDSFYISRKPQGQSLVAFIIPCRNLPVSVGVYVNLYPAEMSARDRTTELIQLSGCKDISVDDIVNI